MKDCIIYVGDFGTLSEHLSEHHPDMISYEEGHPLVVGVARTSAKAIGAEMMVYARLPSEAVELWQSLPTVELWGLTDYTGEGTASSVYSAVFSDTLKLSIYDRIYPRESYDVEADGEVFSVTPPEMFGLISGA